MTRDILELRRSKKRLYRKYCKTKSRIDHVNYKTINNSLSKLTNKEQRKYEQKIINDSKNNPKAFWKFVNSKSKTKEGICELEWDGKIATSDKEKANALNSFFASVFTIEDENSIPDMEGDIKVTKESLINITRERVLKELQIINPNKSPGPDGIHPMVVKNLAEELCDPIFMLFSKSLNQKKIPESWKIGNITPIFKKGDKRLPMNYRPVSLTSVVGKVLEKFVRDAMVEHMEVNNLFAAEQHGFRHKHSCISNLLENMNYVTSELDEGHAVDSIYLDFRKAFDTVPHKRLLKKMEHYKFNPLIIEWVKDFLSNRMQRVVVNGTESSLKPVTSGIPQGSVLGPMLFLVFINDLPKCVESQCYIFADDTKVSRPVRNDKDREILQMDLASLLRWSEKWQLCFNAEKCSVIHIGKNNPCYTYKINDDVNLGVSDSERDLGIVIDSDLSFKQHINSTCNKANQILSIIQRHFKHANSQAKLQLYKALVRSKLEYGNLIWCPRLEGEKDKVEKVQRRATRYIVKGERLCYSERLKRLKLPTLEHRRLRGDLIQTYKIVNNIDTVKDLFTFQTGTTRGHSYKLKKIRDKTRIRSTFYSKRIINEWNRLPDNAVTATSVNCFKNKIDKFHTNTEKFEYKTW